MWIVELIIVNYELIIVNYELIIVNCELIIVNCELIIVLNYCIMIQLYNIGSFVGVLLIYGWESLFFSLIKLKNITE